MNEQIFYFTCVIRKTDFAYDPIREKNIKKWKWKAPWEKYLNPLRPVFFAFICPKLE